MELKIKNFNITGVYWKNPIFRGIGFTEKQYNRGEIAYPHKKINQYLTILTNV